MSLIAMRLLARNSSPISSYSESVIDSDSLHSSAFGNVIKIARASLATAKMRNPTRRRRAFACCPLSSLRWQMLVRLSEQACQSLRLFLGLAPLLLQPGDVGHHGKAAVRPPRSEADQKKHMNQRAAENARILKHIYYHQHEQWQGHHQQQRSRRWAQRHALCICLDKRFRTCPCFSSQWTSHGKRLPFEPTKLRNANTSHTSGLQKCPPGFSHPDGVINNCNPFHTFGLNLVHLLTKHLHWSPTDVHVVPIRSVPTAAQAFVRRPAQRRLRLLTGFELGLFPQGDKSPRARDRLGRVPTCAKASSDTPSSGSPEIAARRCKQSLVADCHQ